jgi:diguanylate cyclase (GGDEF)-like protein
MPVRESEFLQPVQAVEAHSRLTAVLEDVCRLVQSSAQGVMCAALIRAGDELTVVAAPGLTPQRERKFRRYSSGEETVAELEAQLAAQLGSGTNIVAPLLSSRGRSLGVIALHYGPGQLEREDDRELLRSAGRLAALAIEHVDLEMRHDLVAGLSARAHFIEKLNSSLRPPSRTGIAAVACLNLDRFQQINSTLGYDFGDQLLQQQSHRLQQRPASDCMAARIGAGQFALVLKGKASEQGVLEKVRKLLEIVRAPCWIDGQELSVTASVGVAQVSRHGKTAEELLGAAELAMHSAKRAGGNRVEIFREKTRACAIERLHLENALRHAVENEELELLYQPVAGMEGKVEWLEALLTWHHPLHGTVAPGEFIPIAEETGLIAEIGSWVVERACLTGAAWRQAGCRETGISLNVSARQFERDDFVGVVAAALASSGFPPQRLELELTESCVMRDLERSAQRMAEIRALGVSIAIDDFGTGYSSLSYLHKLPVDCIKIDQSFLRGIAQVDGSLPVIQSIVRLAHGMHMTVVAEGVETSEEMELIRLAGCDMAQGHLLGAPLKAQQVQKLLAREARTAAY